MIPNPILKVLSTFQRNRVRALLIGGQATILHGAAEFSRDTDFLLLVTPRNLGRLEAALAELEAERIAFPPLSAEVLDRVHFRCHAEGVEGQRVDLLGALRGCDPFPKLIIRRVDVRVGEESTPVIALRDLVQSKKTQRDKDWLMLRRLVEVDIHRHFSNPTTGQVPWWLRECREPATLIRMAATFRKQTRLLVERRPLLNLAREGDAAGLAAELWTEEQAERDADRAYWAPLKKELEAMRMERLRGDRAPS